MLMYTSMGIKFPISIKPHKLIKHTQTIRQQETTKCLSVLDHFVGLAPKRLTEIVISDDYN